MKNVYVVIVLFLFEAALFGQATQITFGEAGAFTPMWSPDSSMIISSKFGDEESQIWITTLVDGQSRILDMEPKIGGDFHLSWSPDSKEILFDIRDIDGPLRICKIGIEGGAYEIITERGCFQPDWSSDGQYFTYMSDWDIWIRNIDGSNPRRLTSNSVEEYHPDFHPHGSKILFTELKNGEHELYTVSINNGEVDRITNNNHYDDRGRWSPDGSKIVFVSDRTGEDNVWIMNADGTNPYQLKTGLSNSTLPSWAPGGNKIVFSSIVYGEFRVFIIDLVTEIVAELASESRFKLYQNYPNPFNPVTKIQYNVPVRLESNPEGYSVKLTVFDMLGKRVSSLVDEIQNEGIYNVTFNAATLSSGTYIYQLKIGENVSSKKMLLLK